MNEPPEKEPDSAETPASAEEPIEMVIPRPYLSFVRDPFLFVGPHESFLFGLLIILLTGFIGSLTNTHFDGVLDIHTGAAGPLWAFLLPGFLNWLSLAIPLYAVGLAASGTRTRFSPLLGYEAFARAPMLVSVLFTLVPAYQRQVSQPTVFTGDTFYYTAVLAVMVGMIVLMAVWMYTGFKRASGARGWKAIIAFLAALVVGEIVSQVLFYVLVFPAITAPGAAAG